MLRAALGATNLLRAWVLGASFLGLTIVGSCTRELDDPPPLAGGCESAECMMPIDLPPTGSLGGASGAAGTSGEGDGEPVTLEGFVRMVTSADLGDATPLPVPVEVIADAFPQGLVRITTADGSFSLDNVNEDSRVEVMVTPADSSAAVELVPTLQAVDTTTTTDVELFALNREMFVDLIDQSFVVNPTAFDPGLAAAIVTFEDLNGDPRDSVSLVAGSPGQVAYDNGAVYSDALEQTDGRGTLVLLNVPTDRTLLRYVYNQQEYEVRLPRLERGTVTLSTVRF